MASFTNPNPFLIDIPALGVHAEPGATFQVPDDAAASIAAQYPAAEDASPAVAPAPAPETDEPAAAVPVDEPAAPDFSTTLN